VAASSIFGRGATSFAVVVKLTRTLMIIPISLVCSRSGARSKTGKERAWRNGLGRCPVSEA
jgi:uncharacterized membrane protein YadS